MHTLRFSKARLVHDDDEFEELIVFAAKEPKRHFTQIQEEELVYTKSFPLF